ncbi:hypothetical protein PPL_11794 [Heterostelium album PN500]|uniref:peptide chain release factor N(5)-glutamine methyltransferase n=1 Tax=Heterostelium pallidum (strain ATCC 26659 / Pp 5 / PN500) TaxID=670386 RepID=D3BUH4_HETP5|nr:hypothetical protein PPL_11794 [Heterostelium album PN500]EFA74762.1 hypothetical protein PPL_11794 [Heterostelium album PN500]|eukprot:XP_020426896.1 hypothetical protein PPL_11794 [Heterostelium album PN500]
MNKHLLVLVQLQHDLTPSLLSSHHRYKYFLGNSRLLSLPKINNSNNINISINNNINSNNNYNISIINNYFYRKNCYCSTKKSFGNNENTNNNSNNNDNGITTTTTTSSISAAADNSSLFTKFINNNNNNSNNFNAKQLLDSSRKFLKSSTNNDIKESAILDSRILIEHVLQLKPNARIPPTLNLTDSQYQQFSELISRRFKDEPIAYIVGYRYFWKHQFRCDRSTLIPRPDSETLIDQIVMLREYENFSPTNILDLGTGTGCLLLSLLNEFPNATGVGVDQSLDALEIAKYNSISIDKQNSSDNNSSNNIINNRVEFIQSNWLSSLSNNKKYQLIISNPPYISHSDYINLNPTVKLFEPKTALVADNNGLKDYEIIAKSIVDKDILDRDNGLVVFEIGMNQENDIIKIMESNGFELKCQGKDLGRIIRCLVFKYKIK